MLEIPAGLHDEPGEPPEETAEPVHMTAYLAFDLSGSMTGAPLAEAKKAAKSFLRNTNLDHCSLGIIAFAYEVKIKLEASQCDRDIQRAIDSVFGRSRGPELRRDPRFQALEDEVDDLLRSQ